MKLGSTCKPRKGLGLFAVIVPAINIEFTAVVLLFRALHFGQISLQPQCNALKKDFKTIPTTLIKFAALQKRFFIFLSDKGLKSLDLAFRISAVHQSFIFRFVI